jgi:hypothetical protein
VCGLGSFCRRAPPSRLREPHPGEYPSFILLDGIELLPHRKRTFSRLPRRAQEHQTTENIRRTYCSMASNSCLTQSGLSLGCLGAPKSANERPHVPIATVASSTRFRAAEAPWPRATERRRVQCRRREKYAQFTRVAMWVSQMEHSSQFIRPARRGSTQRPPNCDSASWSPTLFGDCRYRLIPSCALRSHERAVARIWRGKTAVTLIPAWIHRNLSDRL